jgi:hypothetical protein
MSIDIREGLTIRNYRDELIEIPPHSERVYLESWANGYFDFLFYSEPQEGFDPSGRIHFMIKRFNMNPVGLLMNVEDAISIVRGLTICIQEAIAAGVPTKPEHKDVQP